MNSSSHACGFRSMLAGWLLVLAYVVTLPSLLPAAFALLARLEGSHGVELCVGGDETRVVLTHHARAGVRSHAAIHRHGVLARVLTALAEPPRGDGPDHLVKFTSGVNRGAEKRAVLPDAPNAADVAVPVFFVIAESPIPRPNWVRGWPKSAPPRPPDGLVGVKSTRLLI